MLMGRRLAFDYGDVRIGVAVCDREGILATPLTTLQTHDLGLWAQIDVLLSEHEPIALYVGRPVHLSGTPSESTHKSEEFASQLRERSKLEVRMIDERLSTVSSQRQLHEAGVDARTSKSMIDAASAVAILEFALQIEKSAQR